nr:hypothetical protein Itr_chr11CG19960 [Ipomoea trifida]GLL40023.1 hypothetical protein Itr_chr11CG19970 [Ipomoea trifida]
MLDHRSSSLPSLRKLAGLASPCCWLPSLQPLTTARVPLLLLDAVVDQEARGRRDVQPSCRLARSLLSTAPRSTATAAISPTAVD